MPLLIVAFTLFVILAAIALTPFAIVQRYRLGTARRRARGWTATLNVAGLAFSSALFLAGAGITSVWVPNALTLTLMGFVSGCLLGLVGLAVSRWEPLPGSLHYTPNRWLVLGITLVVTARLALGSGGPGTRGLPRRIMVRGSRSQASRGHWPLARSCLGTT